MKTALSVVENLAGDFKLLWKAVLSSLLILVHRCPFLLVSEPIYRLQEGQKRPEKSRFRDACAGTAPVLRRPCCAGSPNQAASFPFFAFSGSSRPPKNIPRLPSRSSCRDGRLEYHIGILPEISLEIPGLSRCLVSREFGHFRARKIGC